MNNKNYIIILLFITFWFLSCNFIDKNKTSKNNDNNKEIGNERNSSKSDTAKYFKVKRIVDGDTFELENGEKVRLIGIDTPEKWESSKLDRDVERTQKDKKIIQELGLRATLYSDSLLYGQTVKLEQDFTNQDRDRYNRLLRYAYLQDTILFNLKIIEDGYAFAYTKYPFIYLDRFVEAQRKAMENNRGLWGNNDFKEMK